MKLKFYIIHFIIFQVTANEKPFDCGDAEDRLQCRKRCPERRRVKDKTCPFNRICCIGRPTSIYAPLRDLPFYKPPPSLHNNTYNYVINRYNTSGQTDIAHADELSEPEFVPVPHSTSTMKPISNDEVEAEGKHRKSVKYCKKFKELTVDYMHAMPLLDSFKPFTIPVDKCRSRLIPLIVGGKNVTRGEFPHMAAIGYHKSDYIDYLCGGSLISEKFVLTAAHCAETKWGQPVVVMFGSTELYSEQGIEVAVKRTISHPEYIPPSYYNDIAVIELVNEVKFTEYVRPACLAMPNTEAQKPGSVNVATGWGKTGFAKAASMYLMKVLLEILENSKCEKYYVTEIRQSVLTLGINEKLLCATGFEDRYHDTCQGDSGGPIQRIIPGHNCLYEIVGVTSFGKTCGTSIPGVYTKVESYLDWIEEIVWPGHEV